MLMFTAVIYSLVLAVCWLLTVDVAADVVVFCFFVVRC